MLKKAVDIDSGSVYIAYMETAIPPQTLEASMEVTFTIFARKTSGETFECFHWCRERHIPYVGVPDNETKKQWQQEDKDQE